MPASPRVSIGLPVYNGAGYLEEAVGSVIGQTYSNLELLISDNGSTDGTEGIARRFAAEDRRVRYERHEENRGAAWNYNYVFRATDGPLFRWAAHDDRLEPAYLARCVKVLESCPGVAVCYPRTQIIDEDGEIVGAYDDETHLVDGDPADRFLRFMDRYLAMGAECNAVFGLMRRDVLADTSLIAPYPSSDTVLLGELTLRGKIYELDEHLFQRRDHPGTSVRRHTAYGDRAAWFDPDRRDEIIFPHFRWWLQYHRSVAESPLPAADRLRLLGHLHGRYLRMHGHHLIEDLLIAGLRTGRRLTRRTKPVLLRR